MVEDVQKESWVKIIEQTEGKKSGVEPERVGDGGESPKARPLIEGLGGTSEKKKKKSACCSIF